MRKSLSVYGILLLTAILLGAGLLFLCLVVAPYTKTIVADYPQNVKEEDAIFAEAQPRPVIILDAGHGGEDSGAVGIDGTLEKDLNLALTLRLRDLLVFEGWNVVLTRDSDILLYDSQVPLSHKVQDLKNRLDFGVRYPDAVFVSIHMNKFPAESCKGLQIYYSGNHSSSASLAERLQQDIRAQLSPDNHREVKKATSAIYILDRIRIPAVLIECGFLSNREESSLLRDEVYQKKMIAIFATGLYRQFRIPNPSAEDAPSA